MLVSKRKEKRVQTNKDTVICGYILTVADDMLENISIDRCEQERNVTIANVTA